MSEPSQMSAMPAHTHTPSDTHTSALKKKMCMQHIMTSKVQELSHTLCPCLYECVGGKTF